MPDRGVRRTPHVILKAVPQPRVPAVPQFKPQGAAGPVPILLQSDSRETIAFLASTIGFSVIGMAAFEGVVWTWLAIPAIAGLAVTGLLYVTRWVLDNVPPW